MDTDEFMMGVEKACKGKSFTDLPEAFKFFIELQFRKMDALGNEGVRAETNPGEVFLVPPPMHFPPFKN